MNSYKIAIKQYFVDHLQKLKSDILPRQYAEAINTQNNIKQFVKRYSRNNPIETAIIRGELTYQNGGASKLDNIEFRNKLTNLITLFNTFNDMSKQQNIKDRYDGFLVKLDEIITKLTDKSNALPSIDKISNDIQILNVDIAKFFAQDAKFLEARELRIPYVEFYNDSKFTSVWTKIFEAINNNIATLDVADSSLDSIDYGALLAKLITESADANRMIDTEYEKVKTINDIMRSENDLWDAYLKYDKEKMNQLVYVKTVEDYKTDIQNALSLISDPSIIPILDSSIIPILQLCTAYDDKNVEIAVMPQRTSAEKFNCQKKILQNNNNFVTEYNKIITYAIATTHNIPVKIYDGGDIMLLTNNIIMNDNHSLHDLYKKTADQIQKFGVTTPDIFDPEMIFSPDFSKFTGPNVGVHAGGGDIPTDLITKINEIRHKQMQYFDVVSQYKKLVKIYNRNQRDMIKHTLFFVSIITNQLFAKTCIIYEYIGRGTIAFYNRILKSIIEKIYLRDPSPHIEYLKRDHWATIQILHYFLDILETEMRSEQIIDIRACTDETNASLFLLFNYFKTILDEYNATFQDKLTIYARINDIKANELDPDIDIDNKIFISDCERKMHNDKGYHKFAMSGNKLQNQKDKMKQNDIWKEKVLNEKYNETVVQKQLQSKKIDLGLMYVRIDDDEVPKLCDGFYNPENNNNLVRGIQSIRFTEVFDSVQHRENKDISKYMSMATQLSQGNGIALLTYGYSGTGKTYTLFGNSERRTSGLLQSTLTTITNLKKINFRIYEIYGHGVPYPFYWKEPDNSTRLDKISHQLFSYDLHPLPTGLEFRKVEMITAEKTHINDFVEAKMGDTRGKYVEINTENVDNMFKTFDIFVTKIEECRQNETLDAIKLNSHLPEHFRRRVRGTPNNPVSSRSVLIFDFKLTLFDKEDEPVQFLIVDLPGREEIIQTYVDPYFENPVMKTILHDSINLSLRSMDADTGPDSTHIDAVTKSMAAQAKILAASIALNPLQISVADAFGVINAFNSLKTDIRREIFTTEMKITNKIRNENDLKQFLRDVPVEHWCKKDKCKWTRGTTPAEQAIDSSAVVQYELYDELVNVFTVQLKDMYIFNKGTYTIDTSALYENRYGMYSADIEYARELKIKNVKQINFSIIAIYLLNRIILLNKFDALYEINKYLLQKHINEKVSAYIDSLSPGVIIDKHKDLMGSGFKQKEISDIGEHNYNKDTLKKITMYDYYLTGLEGIYINENIVGLIQYLVTNKDIVNPGTSGKLDITEQDPTLDFNTQKNNIRMKLRAFTEDELLDRLKVDLDWDNNSKPQPVPNQILLYDPDHKPTLISYNVGAVDDEIKNMKKIYKSYYIFNKDRPIIKDILNAYLKHKMEYKVFYLFANYGDPDKRQQKCLHQYNLLANTKNFITSLVKND
jgi:hypothetical protein